MWQALVPSRSQREAEGRGRTPGLDFPCSSRGSRKSHGRCPGKYPRRTRGGHHRAKAYRTWQEHERPWRCMDGCSCAKKGGFAFDHIESGVFLIGRIRKGGSPHGFQVLEDGAGPLHLWFTCLDDSQPSEIPERFLLGPSGCTPLACLIQHMLLFLLSPGREPIRDHWRSDEDRGFACFPSPAFWSCHRVLRAFASVALMSSTSNVAKPLPSSGLVVTTPPTPPSSSRRRTPEAIPSVSSCLNSHPNNGAYKLPNTSTQRTGFATTRGRAGTGQPTPQPHH